MQTEHTPSALPELLTTDQAADLLQVKPASLVTWRCTKAVRVPFVKIGHAVRYRRRDLEAFLSNNLREG